MKLVAFYLPQFHPIPENNSWWGEGFTEWVNVKKAKPLFHGHYQPREPYKDNYYDLMEDSVMEWQMNLAKKYGISAFCFYHYWFCGKKVLEKPVEHLLQNKNATLPFCMAWANEPWTRTWHGAGGEKEVLIRQQYGGEKEWIEHFNYLVKFFKDERYIKINNMPVLLIYKIGSIANRNNMFRVWNELAIESGFDGIFLVKMQTASDRDAKCKYIKASVDFEPGKWRRNRNAENKYLEEVKKRLREKFKDNQMINRLICNVLNYDKINKEMISIPHKKNEFRGIFVDYDDSPRRGKNAIITTGSTPAKFEKYLTEQIRKSIQEQNEYLFINAWNEWGESNYLEPDKRYGYSYLHAVRRALQKTVE